MSERPLSGLTTVHTSQLTFPDGLDTVIVLKPNLNANKQLNQYSYSYKEETGMGTNISHHLITDFPSLQQSVSGNSHLGRYGLLTSV